MNLFYIFCSYIKNLEYDNSMASMAILFQFFSPDGSTLSTTMKWKYYVKVEKLFKRIYFAAGDQFRQSVM